MANLIAYSGKVVGGGSDDPRVGDLNDLTTTDKSSVVGAINEVNGKFSGLTFTTDGLSTTNCSILVGGYVKIGQLVIVSMRIRQTDGANFYVRGFPTYTAIANRVAVSMVDINTNTPVGTGIATNGELGYATSTNHDYIVSCVYIAD